MYLKIQHGLFIRALSRYRQRMDVTQKADELAKRMATQLRVRGETLSDVTGKAGRKLPRHLRAEAQTVIQAETMAKHPKLARMVDEKRVAKAERKLNSYLSKQNPRAERMGEILDRVAAVAFVLFTIVVIAFFVLLSRGYFD